MDYIIELNELFRGSILFSFVENKVSVGLNTKTEIFRISGNKPITNEILQNFKTNLQQYIQIITKLHSYF